MMYILFKIFTKHKMSTVGYCKLDEVPLYRAWAISETLTPSEEKRLSAVEWLYLLFFLTECSSRLSEGH
jgi:hypothetical protein